MILKPRDDSPVEGWIILVIRSIHEAAATLDALKPYPEYKDSGIPFIDVGMG